MAPVRLQLAGSEIAQQKLLVPSVSVVLDLSERVRVGSEWGLRNVRESSTRANFGLVLGAVSLFAAMGAPALSADLGGDCCADLEERIAELEATTARKGNRKVSLTISGWVNEAVFGWDDGTAHGVYQGTNSLEQSRFRFTGEAKIDKDWSAGFVLEVGVQGNPSSQFARNPTGAGRDDHGKRQCRSKKDDTGLDVILRAQGNFHPGGDF